MSSAGKLTVDTTALQILGSPSVSLVIEDDLSVPFEEVSLVRHNRGIQICDKLSNVCCSPCTSEEVTSTSNSQQQQQSELTDRQRSTAAQELFPLENSVPQLTAAAASLLLAIAQRIELVAQRSNSGHSQPLILPPLGQGRAGNEVLSYPIHHCIFKVLDALDLSVGVQSLPHHPK